MKTELSTAERHGVYVQLGEDDQSVSVRMNKIGVNDRHETEMRKHLSVAPYVDVQRVIRISHSGGF